MHHMQATNIVLIIVKISLESHGTTSASFTEYKIARFESCREVVVALEQDRRAIFTRSQGDIEPGHKLAGQSSQFHICQILANTAERAGRKWVECFFVFDQVRLTRETFRDKAFCLRIDALVCC
jgi:hypothetical protein